jgi:ferric-dicitrate binding protein FerR (iron transport regulator)
MKKLGLTLLVAIMGAAAAAHGQSAFSTNARLAIRSGLVEVQRKNVWLPILPGDAVNPGDRIRTASGSVAALEIGAGTIASLNAESQVLFDVASASPVLQLESGRMKVLAASKIQVGAKDTLLEAAEWPVNLELGYFADNLDLVVLAGAVRHGSIVIRGTNHDPNARTHVANGMPRRSEYMSPQQIFYVYPSFLYGNPDPNAGRIVPPVVNNPTNPGYRPTQIVPPMSDPIRVPVTRQ